MREFGSLLRGQVAIITGGAHGIGWATAELFAANGASVVVADVDDRALAAADARVQGRAITTARCDVTSAKDVDALISSTTTRFGGFDIMVNNAGFTRDGTMRRMSEDEFDDVIAVHLKGCWLGTRAASSAFRQLGCQGSIVNMSSISGKVGNPGQTNYSAAKAGIVGLTKAAAKEVGFAGVRVNAVAPGLIDSPMARAMPDDVLERRLEDVPLGRLGRSDEVAAAVLFLASDLASFITGTTIEVTGGRHV
jgi:3-oxoacyl-[acyl-carrier protein] reductase